MRLDLKQKIRPMRQILTPQEIRICTYYYIICNISPWLLLRCLCEVRVRISLLIRFRLSLIYFSFNFSNLARKLSSEAQLNCYQTMFLCHTYPFSGNAWEGVCVCVHFVSSLLRNMKEGRVERMGMLIRKAHHCI